MADMSRRDVLRYGAAGAATVATAAVTVQVMTAGGSAAGPHATAAAPDPRDFDEDYKGKKIVGKHKPGLAAKHDLHIGKNKLAVTAISTLFVSEDGSEPHVGIGLISAVNHYAPVEIDDDKHKDGLKELARKVVDILGEKGELTPEAAQDHHH